MKKILVLGAGQSTAYLIPFLLEQAEKHDWLVAVGDVYQDAAAARIDGHPRGEAIYFDVNDAELRSAHIKEADLVVNMLPPTHQHVVGWDCAANGAHMVSASYEDIHMKDLDMDANRRGILILNEMGLDPGIDHMSAMEIIADIRRRGGHVESFKSYGCGLPAPDADVNPLRYAITWNPRNIVMAGEWGATYLVDGKIKMLPSHEVFQRTWPVQVDGVGQMEAYPNRDSLYYRQLFGLNKAHTMIRGTMRYPGWCETWLPVVRLGLPNETMRIPDVERLAYRDITEMFLPVHMGEGKLEARLADYLKINPTGQIMQNLEWLGLFSDDAVPAGAATVSEVMIDLLRRKLELPPGEKDMIVIMHEIDARFPDDGNRGERIVSTLVQFGERGGATAMSKAVGLPAGIAATLILNGEIRLTGCQLPTHPAVHTRVLEELKTYGVKFKQSVNELK
jgi:saccharopine dehydrogenase-like NADP-dependent oxidoreductase